jgi:hypothetical protein
MTWGSDVGSYDIYTVWSLEIHISYAYSATIHRFEPMKPSFLNSDYSLWVYGFLTLLRLRCIV